jgi:hypothetical protein
MQALIICFPQFLCLLRNLIGRVIFCADPFQM